MKILFLNTWNGRIEPAITEFITEQKKIIDIFCFQEVYETMKTLCKNILPEYTEFNTYKYVDEHDIFSQSTYIKSTILTQSSETILEQNIHLGLGLSTEINYNNKTIHVCNVHGIARPGEKLDNEERLEQSKKLIEFFENRKGIKIIGGDFNLLPNTESIQLFEKSGYRNLVSEFNIKTTRNHFSWDKYPEDKQYYSDYIFVSKDTPVKDFSVSPLEVSDHLALILTIDL